MPKRSGTLSFEQRRSGTLSMDVRRSGTLSFDQRRSGTLSISPFLEESAEQPISSIKTTAQFYNEIRLEEGYSDEQNVNPLTNFADSGKPNATQGTPSKQGEYVANDLNGHPSILLDGADDFYDMQDSHKDVFQTDFAITFVVKILNGHNTEVFYGNRANPNNACFIFMDGNGDLRFNYIENGNQASYRSTSEFFVAGENPWKIITFWADFSNNDVKMRLNGSDIATSIVAGDITNVTPANFNVDLNPYLFARNNAGTDDFHMNCRYAGKVEEKDPTLSDLQNAETKLNEKYAIY